MIDSDLGNVSAFLKEEGDELVLSYLMDMRDATNPEFLTKLEEYKRKDQPINWDDLKPKLSQDSFGKTPTSGHSAFAGLK